MREWARSGRANNIVGGLQFASFSPPVEKLSLSLSKIISILCRRRYINPHCRYSSRRKWDYDRLKENIQCKINNGEWIWWLEEAKKDSSWFSMQKMLGKVMTLTIWKMETFLIKSRVTRVAFRDEKLWSASTSSSVHAKLNNWQTTTRRREYTSTCQWISEQFSNSSSYTW